ncbi:Antigen Cfp30B [Corynebacterium kutscheri]|uniref:Antigen Cfp30B n=1 Tax=Corynebacterium kutscheri TaxID=35755 RepID=A0A0F6TBV5_9CORY|nr:VOC family protein [Corynebacterium kutscheri]AKE40304.1 lactoylglutathione lyase family protein [Corynebacterium kutscheri]VEH05476.1 Antigen Cfp30B [Corynebacterium kutscheri]VEH10697.1 Antigen Cfp30B [Corynebacterium kutscheri]VEH81366.1 Antigen Cfp30B [Corynebacterium kutscheri]
MPAFQADTGMPYWIDLTSTDIRKSSHFYAELLGWEIEEKASEYRIARVQGLPVAGFVARPEADNQPDTWVTYFLSGDINADCTKITELGGRVLSEPMSVELGHMAVAVDNAGALFGLIQPAGEDSFIAAGEPGTPVWHELSATINYEQVTEFYAELFQWSTAELGEVYTTALIDGAAFAGIFDAEGNFPPQVPSFWQSYLGVADIETACARAVELGGEIIRQPWDSEFGRLSVIADSTGATVTLCEVDEPVLEEISESDPLEGIDLSQWS